MKPLVPALLALASLSGCAYFNTGSSVQSAPQSGFGSTGLPSAATAAVAPNSGAAGDELLSAQAAYRQAVQTQNSNDRRISSLQTKLADAEKRKQEADADISRYRTELQQASEAKTGNDSATQAAGTRLNAAWEAARQAGLVR